MFISNSATCFPKPPLCLGTTSYTVRSIKNKYLQWYVTTWSSGDFIPLKRRAVAPVSSSDGRLLCRRFYVCFSENFKARNILEGKRVADWVFSCCLRWVSILKCLCFIRRYFTRVSTFLMFVHCIDRDINIISACLQFCFLILIACTFSKCLHWIVLKRLYRS